MRTVAKVLSLVYGTQMFLSGAGMAVFCYLSPEAFAEFSNEIGFDIRLFIITVGLLPQVGLGMLLIWLGMPTHFRTRAWRFFRLTCRQILEI